MGASGNVRAGRAYVEIMLNQTRFERGLKAVQGKLKSFSSSLTTTGAELAGVAVAAGAPFAMASRTFADFDDGMRMVRGVTRANQADFEMLTQTAEKLGRETSFTAKQVAEGMTAMGRMGFNPKEIDNAVSSVLNLSRATGTELGEAAGIAANNMRVFGIDASQMANVSDILTATANGSAQTLTDLAEGLKMAGPQAAAAKDNIENVAGSLGILANMGIKGSLAGTALRKAYSQFANVRVQNKLKDFGISTVDKDGNLRAMPEIMADIGKAMAAMPTAQKLSFAEDIFDLRGSLAGLQLGGNAADMEKFIDMLRNCKGTAQSTAEEMDKGIGGAFRRFMSAVEGVQIAVGRVIGDALAPFMDKVSLCLNSLAEWAKAHKDVILNILKVIAVVGGAGAALLAMGAALKAGAFAVATLSTVFTALKVAIMAPMAAIQGIMALYHGLTAAMVLTKTAALACWSAVSLPVLAAVVGLGALVAVVWKLTGAWNSCKEALKGIGAEFINAFKGMGETVSRTWEVIKTALASGDLVGAAKAGLAGLKLVWMQGLFPLKKAWAELKYFLNDSWTVTVYGILKAGNSLWYGLLTGLKNIGDAMQDAWSLIWDGIVSSFERTVLELQKAWIRTKGMFSSKEKVQAEISVVEEQYRSRKAAREQSSADAVNRRERERKALSGKWDSSGAAIDAAMNNELMKNSQKYSDAAASAAMELQAAKEQWKTAMDEVKKQAEAKKAGTAEVGNKVRQAQTGTSEAARTVEQTTGGGKATGGWSLEELYLQLGGGNAGERTATATEQIAANTRENNKLIKKLGSNPAAGLSYS